MADKNVHVKCCGDSSRSSCARFKMDQHGSPSAKQPVDRIKSFYPNVNEDEFPLPRTWSSQDKCNSIGLTQYNLRVHYKGEFYVKSSARGNVFGFIKFLRLIHLGLNDICNLKAPPRRCLTEATHVRTFSWQ